MRKNITRIVMLLFLVLGCNSAKDKDMTPEQELKEAKKELKVIQKRILQLEKQVNNTDEDEISVRVKTKTVAFRPFNHFITVNGEVKADKNIHVSPEAGGNIISIKVKEGQRVRKGQELGRLNTKAIENSIAEIETNLQLAETLYKRQKNLWEQNIGSEVDLLTAKANRDALRNRLDALNSQLDMAIITSPIDGIVDDVFQKIGEMAGPSIPFARVVNISKLHVYGDVSENYLLNVNEKDSITIHFPAINRSMKVQIFQKANIINSSNRTFRIRANINNKNGEIKPNLLAEMRIRDYHVPEAIVVPSIIVIKDFKGEYLFVADKNSPNYVARKTYVTTGRSNNNETIITGGLEPGQLIITEGFEQVVDETPVLVD